MGELGSEDEHVFDMFAGIGYFTLPLARGGSRVTATEINPTAFRYLLENAVLNDVGDRVDAYMTDCRDLASEIDADRVIMGYYGSSDGSDADGNEGGRPRNANRRGSRLPPRCPRGRSSPAASSTTTRRPQSHGSGIARSSASRRPPTRPDAASGARETAGEESQCGRRPCRRRRAVRVASRTTRVATRSTSAGRLRS